MSFYVTTPIYYVNAAPHLGHAYTTIAADVMARHHRQRGERVFFLTGTDEHGEPVADAAHALGIAPQELADRNAERFRALAPQLHASNDFFIRTTDAAHEAKVQEVLSLVRENGYVYMGTYEGWYCPRCADFKGESEIDAGNRCPIHHIELTREQEDNYFFRLSAFQGRLEELYAQREDFVAPRTRYNEALSFIRSGLRDVPLTRHKLSWGVRVPWDEAHVFYVWFDALLNYYTALTYAPGASTELWPASYHLIGKDILRFHAVYWPALLMAAGLELPEHVFVHGFLLMDGEKMSKSLGNVLDPFAVIERFGADALRFYLFRDVPFGQDGSVSTASFELRYESELANDLGNLASRTIAMVHRYREGVPALVALDGELGEDIDGLVGEVRWLIDRAELTAALEAIWQRVRRLNRYVEERAPWQLAKDPARAGELDMVLSTLVAGLRSLALLLHPYLPASTDRLLGALGVEDRGLACARWDSGAGLGAPLGRLEPLFPKSA
ncbi:MAG TPA: class I tRNA ligase family protein [Solirubrobacteraceae bacterium]|jgi:methionyl-tRNA synthetase|nr:class I tRNA ligase family protein [Solirubrobacteraceae bacterium]